MNIRLPRISIGFPTEKNALGDNLAHDFLKFGPRFAEVPDWSQTIMADQDKYTGYMYGAITRRVNKVAWLAAYNLKTKANDPIVAAAKKAKTEVEHPYLSIIDSSTTFANDAFWREIQTYVDLKGEYYLMAIRGKAGEKIAPIKEFKLLNPYDITVVYDPANSYEVIGYTETRNGVYREIPVRMIIPVKTLNPFNRTKPWALADAAQDAQFTLKETAQQMRTTARRNRKYPGVVLLGGNGVALDQNQVDNFKGRMRGRASTGNSDEPMFATAESISGGIAWNDMQVDIRKSAVDVVNEIQLNALIAVTGVSKTKLGIEQSGVTRDTAAIQDDLFVTDQAMTALQLIIDALNQDYKTTYPDLYKKDGYNLYIDSPLKEDKDAELTDVTNRTNTFDLYTTLVNKGYDTDTAAGYASGDIPLDDLGEPTNPPKPGPAVTPPVDPVTADPVIEPALTAKASFEKTHNRIPLEKGCTRCKCCDGYGEHITGYECYRCDASGSVDAEENRQPIPCGGREDSPELWVDENGVYRHAEERESLAHNHDHDHIPALIRNALGDADQARVIQQEASLQNAVVNIQGQVVASVLNKVTKNDFQTQGDIIDDADRQREEQELDLALQTFYTATIPVVAASDMARRSTEFNKPGAFNYDADVKNYVEVLASRVASSHMDTILDDILETIQATEERLIQGELKKITPGPNQSPEEVLQLARTKALEGAGREEIARAVRKEYTDISTNRASLIAKTETNRAYNRAQFEADKQFLSQNDLTGRAYKQLVTRSGHPCPYCLELAGRPPIPFDQNFAEVGDTIQASFTLKDGTTSVRQMSVNFEDIGSGNVHPRCECRYLLIIE